MTVRKGPQFVRIFSPMSLMAIGSVFTCAGLAAMFIVNLFPEELLSREFVQVAFYGGFYFLTVGVPALLGFATKVVAAPEAVGETPRHGAESLLGAYLLVTSTGGFLAAGAWLAVTKPDYFIWGLLIAALGALDALVLFPLAWFLLRGRD